MVLFVFVSKKMFPLSLDEHLKSLPDLKVLPEYLVVTENLSPPTRWNSLVKSCCPQQFELLGKELP